MSNTLVTATLTPTPLASTPVAEGDYVSLQLVVAAIAGTSTAYQCVVELSGDIGFQNTPAKLMVDAVIPGGNVPRWNVGTDIAGTSIPTIIGGGWSLSSAVSAGTSPLRIRFSTGPRDGAPWTITFRCKVRDGAEGTATVTASIKASTDQLLYGGDPAIATSTYTITSWSRLTTLTAPTTVTAVASSTSNTVTLGWTDISTGESGYRVYRSTDMFSLPWVLAATLPPGSSSYVDSNLAAASAYYYRVAPFDPTLEGNRTASGSAVTPAAASAPSGAGASVTGAPYGSHTVLVQWAGGTAAGHTGWEIERAPSTDGVTPGTYVSIGRVESGIRAWLDFSATAGAYWFYRIRPTKSSGTNTWVAGSYATSSSSTFLPYLPRTRSAVLTKSLTPQARVKSIEIGGRHMIFSDLERPKVICEERCYEAGLKKLRDTPVLSDLGAGSLSGTFTAYVILFRSAGAVRSVPSVVSNSVTVTNRQLRVTLPQTGGKINFRDYGCDLGGNIVDGVDYWEVYLAESNMDRAVRVGKAPVTSATFDVSSSLTAEAMADGTRRKMELLGENTIWPSVCQISYRNNRIYGTQQWYTIEPAAGQSVAIAAGTRILTGTLTAWSDLLFHRQLYIAGRPTGWDVSDVISGTSMELTHSNPAQNAAGWSETEVSGITTFQFVPYRNRIYSSSFYNGEAGGLPTFAPEGVSPLNYMESEFDPDDGETPNGLISSRDVTFVTKPSKIFAITGGGTAEFFSDLSAFAVTRTQGVLAPNTMCVDNEDIVYALGQSGPIAIRQSGVRLVGEFMGVSRLFWETFEIIGAEDAVGEWFTREKAFIVTGLNAMGCVGKRDGFIMDARTNKMGRFETPRWITCLTPTSTKDNEQQMLFGDEGGNVGILFPRNTSTDDVDLTRSNNPFVAEKSATIDIVSPRMIPVPVNINDQGKKFYGPGELRLLTFIPTMTTYPGVEAVSCVLDECLRPRMGKLVPFTANGQTMSFLTTDGRDSFKYEGYTTQSWQGRLRITVPRGERVIWSSLMGIFQIEYTSNTQSGG